LVKNRFLFQYWTQKPNGTTNERIDIIHNDFFIG
jgi:hypothetical protein